MMQTAVEGLPMFSQETPSAPGETQTLSEINIAPAVPFSLNQNSVVCLPVVSGSKRVVWINFDQTSLQLDSATELQLDKAFDGFPYLTQDETAALAQCCSLHPDQVKLWFMVQRLRYGISWDYEDIKDVQEKIKSSWGMRELKKDKGGKKRSGRKKGKKVMKEQSAKEGSTMGENMSANKQEKPMKKENDSKVGELELVVPDEVRDAPPLSSQAVNVPQVTDNQTPNMESGLNEKAELELKLECEDRRLRNNWKLKTHAQLVMMKEAFSRCQYPDSKEYDQLSVLTGVSRHTLVQWYGDMRYYIKERKPGWMTEEQHSQALANIRYRQYLNTLARCGEDQNVQVPPE